MTLTGIDKGEGAAAGEDIILPVEFAGRELYPGDGRYADICGSTEDFTFQIVLEYENHR